MIDTGTEIDNESEIKTEIEWGHLNLAWWAKSHILALLCCSASCVWSLLHADGCLADVLSDIGCHGPEGGNLLCQPWHSNITLTPVVRGEDYMVHHALTAKGSERQHLLATHSTSCTYSETLSECWVELTNVFSFAFVELFVETVRVFLNPLQYVHSLPSDKKHSYCILWLRWLRYKFIKDHTRNII